MTEPYYIALCNFEPMCVLFATKYAYYLVESTVPVIWVCEDHIFTFEAKLMMYLVNGPIGVVLSGGI